MSDSTAGGAGLEFLGRGGEMGCRMRSFDWAATPLGAPAGWPQSLKTIVRMMLDSRFAMWMAWGPEGRFFCNDAYLPTVGNKRDWVLGARADRVWAEIWHDIGPRIAHVLGTGEATWDEGLQLFLQRSGYTEETFHTFSYSPVYDDDNRVAGMLCVVVEDTERAIGERRLRLLSEIAAVQARAAPSLDDAGAALLRVLARRREDIAFAALYLADGQDDGAADPFARYVGGTLPTLAARLPARVALDGSGDARWGIAAALRDGRPQLVADPGIVAGAWEEPVTQALAVPVGAAQGGVRGALGVLVLGISTRRRYDDRYNDFLGLVAAQVGARLGDAQARLDERRRAETLAELDRAKNLFFSNVSHEFRTPLTLMLGPLDELLATTPLPPAARQSLALVQRNGQRLRKLVNTLLDFARIEAGRVQARFQPLDLPALTAELASAFRSAVEQAGLALVVDCPPLSEPVYVDPELWEKVVLNLLSNAFKHTFTGSITVSLRLRPEGQRVELAVQDTGTGIAADELPRLFDRFHRVAGAQARSQEGSGIGLALVRELVQMHGGTIAVDSEPGQGSRFAVQIPLGSAHLPAAAVAQSPAAGPRDRSDWSSFVDDGLRGGVGEPEPAPTPTTTTLPLPGRERVLIADDNADMRAYLASLLEPHWDVISARDGEDAWELLRRHEPALLISDVMMPRLDGEQLLRRIRADESTRLLPVLMLSARAGDEARIDGLNLGADDYLVKPFSARELIARVQAQLQRARALRERAALDQRLADVFRLAPVGLALLRGRDFTFEFANAAYLHMIGGREVAGKPLLQALPELAGQQIDELLEGVYTSGQPHVGRAFPTRLLDARTQQLHEHFFDFIYQPVQSVPGEAPAIVVICFEVTEMVRARQAAEAASRAKEDFIAMLGHELRNPLAPITTALHLMRLQHGDVAAKERGIIERQVRHMVRLVDDLLDIARVSRGNVELRRAPVEAAELVARALETVSPLLERKQHRVRLEVPAQGLLVRGDATRLVQVLANLLTNAAKFSEAGRPIEIEAARTGDTRFELRVRDHGMGMSEKELATVFQPFVQGRQAIHRPDGGLGLGLTIARSLAQLHGGELSAHSDGYGQGCTFVLTLPLQLPQAAVPDPTTAAVPARTAGRQGLALLVVDDNADAATTLATLLETSGHRVSTAGDGPQALALLAGQRFDAAILDIGLPVMDGYELAQAMRRLDNGRELRLIALTGYGQPADGERSRQLGFTAHLVKPVDMETLEAALRPVP